ncbi:hypothetical protein ACSRCL_23130, partial [Salmonella enterica]|uniref:hypothetical protein n=1 Tax=Salmonella enterica TaxID=28901 RepID=UPI003EDC7863
TADNRTRLFALRPGGPASRRAHDANGVIRQHPASLSHATRTGILPTRRTSHRPVARYAHAHTRTGSASMHL